MADITVTMSGPYYGSTLAQVTGENPDIVALDGHLYLLDNRSGAYKRESIAVIQQRNTSDSRDLLLLPQEVWRQSQSGWQQGAGQSNMDREDSLPYRFSASYGIDPWTPWQVSLLPKTQMLADMPGAGNLLLGVHDGHLVTMLGSQMVWWDDLPGASVNASAGSASIISSTYDGDAIITLHSDGEVWRSTAAGTSTLFGTFAGATFIEYVKDYLVCGIGDTLSDITSGSASTVFVSPASGFRWLGACEGLEHIYLVGGNSERWIVHRVGIASDGTGLQPAIVAATLPAGEVASCIGSYLGFVFVGTSNGVRMATANSDGSLTLGSLIPTGSPVRDFEGQGSYVWYTDSAVDGAYEVEGTTLGVFPTGTVCGLGRMDLSTMTVNDGTPAYANDLVCSETTGTVRSIVTFKGKRVFGINGQGVFYETDTYMDAGWVEEGVVTFGVEDTKTGLYLQARWAPLAGSVALDTRADGGDWRRLSVHNLAGSTGSGNVSMQGLQFSRIQGRLVLSANTGNTQTPTVTRWEVRARAVVGNAARWTLPILNHDVLEFPSGKKSRDVQAELDRLDELVAGGKMFILQEGGSAYQVVARSYQWSPQMRSGSRQAWQGVYTLVVDQVI